MDVREIAGREVVSKHQEMVGAAQELANTTAQKLNNFETAGPEQWEATAKELGKTIEALDSLNALGMLNAEQQQTRQKLESQKDYIEKTVLPYLEQRALPKAA